VLTTERSAPPPFTSLGSYRVLCELGRGSMAVVYLARAHGVGGFERLWALKMIHSHLSEVREFVDLFLNEARIAAMIHHPNVIAVHDIDLHEERYYLRMDYVSGETLSAALDRTWNASRPFPIDVACEIVAAACDGLHAAHELRDPNGAPLGLIHRDVGPHNVMIGYDGIVRIMDFGIAKAMDRVSGTQPGVVRGTVAFMSPEQVRGEPLDRRADVFSLGVLLWEMTTGVRLFRHRTVPGTMARILGMQVPRPSTIRRECAAGLERVIMRALERDREKRQPTARALGEELRDYLVGAGRAPSTAHVERFMAELFAERHRLRLAMEHEATEQLQSGRLLAFVSPEPKEVLKSVDAPIQDERLARWLENDEAGVDTAPPRERPDSQLDLTTPNAPLPRDVTVPAVRRPRARRKPRSIEPRAETPKVARSFKIAATILIGGAITAIALMLNMGIHHGEQVPAAPLVMVKLSFRLEPQNAVLKIDGAPHAGELVVPMSPEEYNVEVSLDGYESKTMIVSAEASREITISLEPTQPKKGPATKAKRRRGKGSR
jgi:eukaryotic-like serine/threonine-protein kinase